MAVSAIQIRKRTRRMLTCLCASRLGPPQLAVSSSLSYFGFSGNRLTAFSIKEPSDVVYWHELPI
jgi:hypothetical protein